MINDKLQMTVIMMQDIQMNQIDYLVVGHICSDLTPAGTKVGGTVAYAGRTAETLGYQTAVLTSAAKDYNFEQALPHIRVHHITAAKTTTFENIYTSIGRQQRIHSIAESLRAEHMPKDWLRSQIVHLGPLVDEVEPELIHLFDDSLVGLTLQGWMRSWDENGRVFARNWPAASEILPLATAVILSEEDLVDTKTLEDLRRWSKLLVLTQGSRGCTIFHGDEMRHIPTEPIRDVDPTGAGDVFAAAFLVRLHQTGGNPWEAGRFANEIATATIAHDDLEAKVAQIKQMVDLMRPN
jgi:sugar/nucleoside kinase (ribokinase family)